MVTKVENRDIKYPRIEFRDGTVKFIMPLGMDYSSMMDKYSKWIEDKKSEIKEALEYSANLSFDTKSEEAIKTIVNLLIDSYSEEYGLVVNRLIFRKLKSKWGSCSNQGNLTFNVILKYLPDRHLQYVVFHEIMHMIERKHSRNFWALIAGKFPEYKQIERELLSYWFAIHNIKQKR